MSRKSTLEPRWLVSMLTAWVKYCVKSWDSGLGYPDRCVFLTDRVDGYRSRSGDGISLNAYDKQDFEKIERVMQDFRDIKPNLYAVTMMYYKPWKKDSYIALGHPFGNSTYYDRLHAAHAWLAERLKEVERRFLHVEEESIV